jgi:hypothetical protein
MGINYMRNLWAAQAVGRGNFEIMSCVNRGVQGIFGRLQATWEDA